MRHRFAPSAALAAISLLTLVAPAGADLKLPRPSPGASASQTIGLTDITVKYSRPGVKGRVIWGELVPYDKPWRTGANEATTFTTSSALKFGDKDLPAGTYSLVTMPGKDQWSVILNSEENLWGGTFSYKPEKNVLEIKVTPTATTDSEEWLRFSFENLSPGSADLVMHWEKLAFSVPLAVDVNGMSLANITTALATSKPDDWNTPYQAANWSFNNNVSPDQGRTWLDKSLATQKTFQNLSLQAKWQMKDGKKPQAIATAKEAIAAGKASKDTVDTAPTEKLLAEWSAAK